MRKILGFALAMVFAAASLAADLGYDPSADPFEQYRAAIEQAAASNKLVLIVAGGDWCRWCHILNRFVSNNKDVEQALNDTFVVMKVYVGPENYNEMFFSQLPEAYGAPHFWIVSPQREVLGSQSTAKLERGRNGYDKESFLAFIGEWRERMRSERYANVPATQSPAQL
ncbi:MAG TPA: thioredoxin family protein [Steroidobacteraceae bacterium]